MSFRRSSKLMFQSYSSTPESPLCAGFFLFTGSDSYELQNYKSNVSSQESKQKSKDEKAKKCKSNDEGNSIILKSFIYHVNANTNTGYNFFSLIMSQSITSDCPAEDCTIVPFVQFYGVHRTINWKWQPIGRSARGGRSQRRSCNTAN